MPACTWDRGCHQSGTADFIECFARRSRVRYPAGHCLRPDSRGLGTARAAPAGSVLRRAQGIRGTQGLGALCQEHARLRFHLSLSQNAPGRKQRGRGIPHARGLGAERNLASIHSKRIGIEAAKIARAAILYGRSSGVIRCAIPPCKF